MFHVGQLFGILIALCSLQACSTHTSATSTASSPPSLATRDAILKRVAIVVVTPQSNLDHWALRQIESRPSSSDADGGSATPISPDGYLLTANHIIHHAENNNIFVLYHQNHRLVPHPARIVWQSKTADLAILHIATPTPNFYTWVPHTESIKAGTPILHGGMATVLNSPTGHLETSISPCNFFTPFQKFQIDLPLKPGDSGGPVCTTHGNLIGINSSVEFLVPMETPYFINSEAIRPNSNRIESILRKDRKSRLNSKTQR